MLLDSMSSPSRYGDHEVMGYDNPSFELNDNGTEAAVAATSNDLDDIFGSAPPSPTQILHLNDRDDNTSHPTSPSPVTNGSKVISDIPRLRTQHVTAGYRDGIANAKAGSVQAGFDEGFALGAEIGMAAGWIRGVLNSMARAMPARDMTRRKKSLVYSRSDSGPPGSNLSQRRGDEGREKARIEIEILSERRDAVQHETTPMLKQSNTTEEIQSHNETQARDAMDTLLELARADLKTDSLFSPLYFDADGVWRYDLDTSVERPRPPSQGPSAPSISGVDIEGARSERDIAFREVALSHPLIHKWNAVIECLAARFAIDLYQVAR